ncbi:MAG TPA: hypothetical protein GXX14_10405 [Clostridiaceae bacterium]|nr:hypothetical protein [Clostridiaceae bacterium]
MSYRRYPQLNRRYYHQNEREKREPSNEFFTPANIDISGTIDDIPLPTDMEETEFDLKNASRPSFLDFIKRRIHIEELILLGLIFLLLGEGIGDEILIILLLYILIT